MTSPASRSRLLIALGVGAVLLAVTGGEEAVSAMSNREPRPVTCSELRVRAIPSAWIRLTGCRVEYASIGFSEQRSRFRRLLRPKARGRITEIFYPLVDPDETPGTVRIVVSSDDPAAIALINDARENPSDSARSRIPALYELAAPIESKPIDGMLRRRFYGSVRPDVVKRLRVPLASDFEILDLGVRPSIRRAALLLSGAVVCAGFFVFVWQSGKAPPAAPARPPVPAYKQAPTAARLSGLMLLNLPPDASAAAIESAPPLGDRARVAALLAELLPGAGVDESGRIAFTRADYSVEIDIGEADPVQTATVVLSGQPSIVAMRRLLRRTGWRLFAPKRGEFIAAEVLGSALADSRPAGTPEALSVPVARAPVPEPWAATARSGRHYSKHVVGLVVLIGVVAALWWFSGGDSIEANEASTIQELAMLGGANLSLRVATGAFAAPEQLADAENASRLGHAALPASFANPVRHGYRFEFRGEPLTDADRPGGNVFPIVDPAFRSFVYLARPVAPDITGRRWFAYYSDQASVYSRLNGVPTPKDTLVPTRP